MKYSTILFPMTAELIHPGHIRCLEWLDSQCDFLIISLLTDKALKGYKKCVVPYKDRKEVLDAMYFKYMVVPQNSLDPTENLKKYDCDAIASGDGWEKQEEQAIKKLKVKRIDVPFPKTWSSTKIKNLIKEQK